MNANFQTMTIAELTEAYNAMVRSPTGQAVGGHREVMRFRDHPTAVARCGTLASSIRAWEAGQREEEQRELSEEGALVRPGSHRAALLEKLLEEEGTFVLREELVEAVYHSRSSDLNGPLAMVFKGLIGVIKARELPYEIRKQKNGRQLSYGIFPTR